MTNKMFILRLKTALYVLNHSTLEFQDFSKSPLCGSPGNQHVNFDEMKAKMKAQDTGSIDFAAA